MSEFLRDVERVLDCDATLLITGETGVGKEYLARAIHRGGRRAEGPFVPVNCAGFPEGLLESELFGHVRGAFTGATAGRRGWFELAQGGTVLLDEIGDMPVRLQGRLLRVLQDRRVVPVGAESPISVDVRVMSATNRSLPDLVAAGAFREDLYYRIAVVPLEIPPLRNRRKDIRPLVERYTRHLRRSMDTTGQRFSERAMEAMEEYSWPGNVRELIHLVKRSLLLSAGSTVKLSDLPVSFRTGDSTACCRDEAETERGDRATSQAACTDDGPESARKEPRGAARSHFSENGPRIVSRHPGEGGSQLFREAKARAVEIFERAFLSTALRASRGNVAEAAKRAKMSRRALSEKLKKYGIDRRGFRS